jgi:hypothetical protein
LTKLPEGQHPIDFIGQASHATLVLRIVGQQNKTTVEQKMVCEKEPTCSQPVKLGKRGHTKEVDIFQPKNMDEFWGFDSSSMRSSSEQPKKRVKKA